MIYDKPIPSNGKNNKRSYRKRNIHIPSIRQVFGLSGQHGEAKIGKYISADYPLVPIGRIREKKIMDTEQLARDWANDRIFAQQSTD